MTGRTNRRSFLRIAVVAGAAPVALAATSQPAAAADTDGAVVVGYVERVAPGQLVLRTSKGPVTIAASAHTKMYSGISGAVSDVASFVVCDRVGVAGQATASGITANRIGSIFTPLTAVVRRVGPDGQVEVADGGRVTVGKGRLPFGALPRKPLGQLAPGSVISGMSWTHPSTRQTYVFTG